MSFYEQSKYETTICECVFCKELKKKYSHDEVEEAEISIIYKPKYILPKEKVVK